MFFSCVCTKNAKKYENVVDNVEKLRENLEKKGACHVKLGIFAVSGIFHAYFAVTSARKSADSFERSVAALRFSLRSLRLRNSVGMTEG